MKKICTYIVLNFICLSINAQDDLMGELDKNAKPSTQYATSTFKSTRVLNGHSVEGMAAKHLDFRISHRFGSINSGAYNFFGLDQALMRMGLEYGITDNLMLGIGRSTNQKTYDYYLKYRLLRQSSGAKKTPFSVSIFANAATTTVESTNFNVFSDRQSYTTQLLIARKFSDAVSIQVTPTLLHRNKVTDANDPNSLFALGIGGRTKLSKRTSLNAEYWLVPQTRPSDYKNCLSIGFDIETGGHVFQLHLSNSRGMVENQFIGDTSGSWGNGDIFYGFNISRTFSFDKEAKKMYK